MDDRYRVSGYFPHTILLVCQCALGGEISTRSNSSFDRRWKVKTHITKDRLKKIREKAVGVFVLIIVVAVIVVIGTVGYHQLRKLEKRMDGKRLNSWTNELDGFLILPTTTNNNVWIASLKQRGETEIEYRNFPDGLIESGDGEWALSGDTDNRTYPVIGVYLDQGEIKLSITTTANSDGSTWSTVTLAELIETDADGWPLAWIYGDTGTPISLEKKNIAGGAWSHLETIPAIPGITNAVIDRSAPADQSFMYRAYRQ